MRKEPETFSRSTLHQTYKDAISRMAKTASVSAEGIRSVYFQYDSQFHLTPTVFQLEEWARDPQSGLMSETAL